MNALTLTEDFQISASERDAYKVALARAEGDLLIIAAHRRLGLNTSTDEDGFPYYVWEMADVARDLAELSVRELVPASWQSFFENLCHMARNIDEAAWTLRIPMIPVSDSGDFDRASRAGYFLL